MEADSLRDLGMTVLGSGVAQHFAELDVLGRTAAQTAAGTFTPLGTDRLRALTVGANLAGVGASSVDMLNGGVAPRFAELDGLSRPTAAQTAAGTFTLLGTDRFEALTVSASLAGVGASNIDVLSSGVASRFAELGALSQSAAALRLAETLNPYGVAALGSVVDAARLYTMGTTVLGSGLASRFPELNCFSSRAGVTFPLTVNGAWGGHESELLRYELVTPPSAFHLVQPYPAEPFIVRAKCGREMTIQRDGLGETEGRGNVTWAYPQCECVVGRPRRPLPTWFRGTIKGGGHCTGVRAGTVVLRAVPSKGKPQT